MENYDSIIAGENTRKILSAFAQPLTATQLSKKTSIPVGTVQQAILKLSMTGLVLCINPSQRNSRVYRLTKHGIQVRNKVCQNISQTFKEYNQPSIDWNLYGCLCFNHRTAVIKILTEPMQPSEIKRVFRMQRHKIRINSNNIRDIIKFFMARGIVRPVKVNGRAYLRYELTDLGNRFRHLLIQAEIPFVQNSEKLYYFENYEKENETAVWKDS